MTDISLLWDNDRQSADIGVAAGALVTDDGLRTAILLSLFTDARAAEDDALPEASADRRGWWGNAFPPVEGDDAGELGSKLWLLDRAKTTAATLRKAEEYARDALAWIVADQIAAAIDVTVERQIDGPTQRLALAVILDRPTAQARARYDFVWEASL